MCVWGGGGVLGVRYILHPNLCRGASLKFSYFYLYRISYILVMVCKNNSHVTDVSIS